MTSPIRPTTLLHSTRLSQALGARVTLASETFQHTGSFKFRAAYMVASSVPHEMLITASSGNFGFALSQACRLLGKRAIVVMPTTSAKVKSDAVAACRARVEWVDTSQMTRAARLAQVAQEHPDAYVASPYDDPLVIRGNASLGAEIARLPEKFDFLVAPVGGGGLMSGLITGLKDAECSTACIGAEPALANDLSRSLAAGTRLANETEPPTLADGARTISVGTHNWEILSQHLSAVVEVQEDHIRQGVRMLFELANLKAEPTAALSIGALLAQPERFAGHSVICVISGGNVDPERYCELLR